MRFLAVARNDNKGRHAERQRRHSEPRKQRGEESHPLRWALNFSLGSGLG